MRTFLGILAFFLMLFPFGAFGQRVQKERAKKDSGKVRFGKKVEMRSLKKEKGERASDPVIFGKKVDTIHRPSPSGKERPEAVRFGKKADTIRSRRKE